MIEIEIKSDLLNTPSPSDGGSGNDVDRAHADGGDE